MIQEQTLLKEHPQRSSTSSSSLGDHNKTKNIDRTAAEENPIRSISGARSLSVFVVVFNPKTEHDLLYLLYSILLYRRLRSQ